MYAAVPRMIPAWVAWIESVGEVIAFTRTAEAGSMAFARPKSSTLVRFLQAVNVGDVGVIERGQRYGLALKAGYPVGIAAELRREDFDCNVTLQLRVAGAIHIAHAARTEVHLHFIGSKTPANELTWDADPIGIARGRGRFQKTSGAFMREDHRFDLFPQP